MQTQEEHWDLIIQPKTGWFDLHVGDIWRYRDLICLFVKRDFVAFYKQTILGPLWYIIQPILTTTVFTIVFGNFANLSTDGIPRFLFYLSGTVAWGYFANCITQTSSTFTKNAGIFSKVYFPRLTVPISIVIIDLVKFLIQFTLFLVFLIYFIQKDGSTVRPNMVVLFVPLLILQMAVLGLGMGILVSSLTTKYRDLTFVMGFGVQLWMYVSSVVIPASSIPEKYRALYMLNPMASIIELFRYAFLGEGVISGVYITFSWIISLIVLFAGVMVFNKIEKSFMDTV